MLIALLIASAGEPLCWELAAPLARGAAVRSEDLAAAACDRERQAAFLRFDRGSATVLAGDDLPAGSYVGRLALPDLAVERGAQMVLVARSGPVTIERQVVAMQPGRAGGKLFVRDEDGQILSVELPSAAAAEVERR